MDDHGDIRRTLSERFGLFVRAEPDTLARRAAEAGHAPLSEVELDALRDTAVALLAHHAGPAGTSVSRERLIGLVDHVLMVLLTGTRAAE